MKYLVFQQPDRMWSWKLIGDGGESAIDCAVHFESRKDALDDAVKFRCTLGSAVILESNESAWARRCVAACRTANSVCSQSGYHRHNFYPPRRLSLRSE